MAIQWCGPTFDINWFTVLTANALLALVATIVYMRDPTWTCMEHLPFPFAHSQFFHSKVLTILNSHRMEFRPVCILPYWKAWGPLRFSSFGSWWWYGLLYLSRIGLLGNNATLRDRSFQILSWAPNWATSIGLYFLQIWSNCPYRGLSPTNPHQFVLSTTNDPLGSYKNNCWWRVSWYGGTTSSVIVWAVQSLLVYAHKMSLPSCMKPSYLIHIDLHLQYSIYIAFTFIW